MGGHVLYAMGLGKLAFRKFFLMTEQLHILGKVVFNAKVIGALYPSFSELCLPLWHLLTEAGFLCVAAVVTSLRSS